MAFLELLPPLLALALLAGGLVLVLHGGRRRKRALSRRLALIGGAPPPAGEAGSESGETTLLRLSETGLRDDDLMAIARICRHFGLRPRTAPLAFAGARLAAGAALAGLTLLTFGRLGQDRAAIGLLSLALAPASVALGWLAPVWIVRKMNARRSRIVSAGLPEALELLVVCVEAGLALEDGLDRITAELRRSQPRLAEELQITAADLKILPDRDAAFAKLAERVGSPSIRSVVATLSQTLRYGTPLAGALRVAAAELRNDALLALEERANRLPTVMTVPMMLFILPTIFIIVGGPAVLRLIDTFFR